MKATYRYVDYYIFYLSIDINSPYFRFTHFVYLRLPHFSLSVSAISYFSFLFSSQFVIATILATNPQIFSLFSLLFLTFLAILLYSPPTILTCFPLNILLIYVHLIVSLAQLSHHDTPFHN